MPEPTDVRALTVRQPWASLIATGAKTIETRSWRTDWRGTLLIHAGSDTSAMEQGENATGTGRGWFFFGNDGHRRVLRWSWMPHIDGPLPLGAVVAVATLADVVPIVDHLNEYEVDPAVVPDHNGTTVWLMKGDQPARGWREEQPLGDFTPGRWAWLLTDVRPIDPVPAKGRQGLWRPTPEVVEACRA